MVSIVFLFFNLTEANYQIRNNFATQVAVARTLFHLLSTRNPKPYSAAAAAAAAAAEP